MLTPTPITVTMNTSPHWDTGRGNLVSSIGEKSPHLIAAFLCPSFSAAVSRVHSVMAGCFGQRLALAGPIPGFPPHYSPSPDTVESIGGGYPSLVLEQTA